MQGLNSIQLIGNLGRDPELRHTAGGKAVTNLRLAVSIGRGDNQRTDWFDVVVWDSLAEACHQYLHTGSRIFVAGRLQIRQWEGNDGQARCAAEVVARQVLFLDPPAGTGAPEAGQADEAPDLPF
jgi:single-strand DNA-binding protein